MRRAVMKKLLLDGPRAPAGFRFLVNDSGGYVHNDSGGYIYVEAT